MNENIDWKGNSKSVHSVLGASSHSESERAKNDYYATDPKAIKLLLELETFNKKIWEPACGEGHLSKELEKSGYDVYSTDIIDRNYGNGILNFLDNEIKCWDGDIITNPPYSFAKEFIEKAIDIIDDGNKICMFLKLQFLEGKGRKSLFEKYPPKTVWVSSSRINCARNGVFIKNEGSAVAYAWYVWIKGFKGSTELKWFN